MAGGDPARRYAEAAFELAREEGAIDRWRQDLRDIADAFSIPELQQVLVDDRIPLEERYRIVERVLDVHPLALNLAKLLVRRGRVGIARRVAAIFAQLADAYSGIVDAEVTTAVELGEDERDRIRERLKELLGREVRISTRVDPTIVGGVVVRVGDQVIDGSVRTRLRLLRDQLVGAA